jgi:hypothetical protein
MVPSLETLDRVARVRAEQSICSHTDQALQPPDERPVRADVQYVGGRSVDACGSRRRGAHERRRECSGNERAQRPAEPVLLAVMTHRAPHPVLARVCKTDMITS